MAGSTAGSAGGVMTGGAGGAAIGGMAGSTAGAGGGGGMAGAAGTAGAGMTGLAGASGMSGAAGTAGSAGGTAGSASLCGTLGWGLNTMVAVAPGGASFALATSDGHVETRRWSDNTTLGINNGFYGATAIAYSPDGAFFAAATDQGVKIWRVSDSSLLATIPALAQAMNLALSNDASVVAGLVPLTGLVISRPAGLLTINVNARGVAVSPDGTAVAVVDITASGSKFAPYAYSDELWSTADGHSIFSLAGGTGSDNTTNPRVLFSRDGTLIAFGPGDAASGSAQTQVVRTSDGTIAASVSLAVTFDFSDDDVAVVAYAANWNALQIVRLSDGTVVRSIMVTGAVIAAGFETGTATPVAVVDARQSALQLLTDGAPTGTIPRVGYSSPIYSVAISPDGSRVIAGGNQLWDTSTSTVVGQFSGGRLRKQIASFSPDSVRLGVCEKNSVSVYQVKPTVNTTALFTIPVQADAVAFSPDGTLLVTGDVDDTAKLWNATNGTAGPILWSVSAGHTSSVESVGFSPDGTKVVTAAGDATIKVWSAADGTNIRTISTGQGSAGTVAFSPDGTKVLGVVGNNVDSWDVATGALAGSVSGDSLAVAATKLFAGDPMGHGIGRYDPSTLANLGPLPFSTASATLLSVTPSGSILASGGGSSPVVHLWCSP